MQRREFVKALMAATVAAPAALGQQAAPVKPSAPPAAQAPGPLPWTRGLSGAKPLPVSALVPDAIAEANTQYFSTQQLATLRRLGDLLMPPSNGFPGATDAGVPEFLDFLIGVSPDDRQKNYTAGLDRLESDARHKFGIPFAATQPTQADQLIRPFLRAWMHDHPPADPYEHFINIAHSDIRNATINSQQWSDAATAKNKSKPREDLFWYPIDPDLRGLATVTTRHSTVKH